MRARVTRSLTSPRARVPLEKEQAKEVRDSNSWKHEALANPGNVHSLNCWSVKKVLPALTLPNSSSLHTPCSAHSSPPIRSEAFTTVWYLLVSINAFELPDYTRQRELWEFCCTYEFPRIFCVKVLAPHSAYFVRFSRIDSSVGVVIAL